MQRNTLKYQIGSNFGIILRSRHDKKVLWTLCDVINTHAHSPLCQSFSTIYCAEAYKRWQKFAEVYGSLRKFTAYIDEPFESADAPGCSPAAWRQSLTSAGACRHCRRQTAQPERSALFCKPLSKQKLCFNLKPTSYYMYNVLLGGWCICRCICICISWPGKQRHFN